MTAETVSSRGKDNKQHLDENRLTLTYNKRRSPFHLPTAERLGATGGEPPQRVREEPSGWATGGEPTVHIKLGRSGIGGHKQTAEHCRMYRRTHARSNVSEMRNTVTPHQVTSHHMATDLSYHGGNCRVESSQVTSHHITSHGDLSYHGGTMSTYGGRCRLTGDDVDLRGTIARIATVDHHIRTH
jgi:hypothetical protein